MKVSAVELRNRIKDVLRALERGEDVNILHRGTVTATIRPASKSLQSATDHPLFGSAKEQDVSSVMNDLRASRYAH